MRLYLLRHAKSSWKDPALADHDRPLSGRGRRAAAAIAAHMAEQHIVPDLVLCSTAVRTRQTFERLPPAPVRYERRIYGARASELRALLRSLPDDLGSVLLIGHSPGLEDLAVQLAEPSPLRDELEAKFPTGALATLEGGRLIAFVRPRDLLDGPEGHGRRKP